MNIFKQPHARHDQYNYCFPVKKVGLLRRNSGFGEIQCSKEGNAPLVIG